MHVRPATADDVEVLVELHVHVHAPHVEAEPRLYRPAPRDEVAASLRERLGQADVTVLLADDAGPCGYAVCEVVRRPATPLTWPRSLLLVDELAVAPARRRRGAGRALMDAAQALARERGLEHVELDVRAVNAGARAFYEALGFAPVQLHLARAVPP